MSTYKITTAEEKKSALRDALEQLRETQALQFELVELANPAPGDEVQEATNNPGNNLTACNFNTRVSSLSSVFDISDISVLGFSAQQKPR